MIRTSLPLLLCIAAFFCAQGVTGRVLMAVTLRRDGACEHGGLMMRLRGGMADDMAAQMAEIRAKRAKEYERQKNAQTQDAADVAAEEKRFVGAQKVWVVATDKLNAKTIQPKTPMCKGDARSFYLDGGVTLLRNRNTGMVIELVHGSTGWFQFQAREGAALQQMSATGNVVPVQRFYAAGLLEEIKGSPLKSTPIPSKGITGGPWSLAIKGAAVVLKHSKDPTREVHLLDEGFVYMSTSADEGIHVDALGSPVYMPLPEAQTIVSSLSA
jgi:hypothetical protein